ncbi:MAG: DUF1178 family protein [Sphingobium sp.]|nr:DUF1178 family protein [Sphingobium sp.]
MIVFDLKCAARDHVFEAWFGSSADYADQKARGLLACPICGDGDIAKAVMAPAVAAKGNSRSDPAAPPASAVPVPAPASAPSIPVGTMPDPSRMQAMLQAVAQAQSEMLKDSTWVGRDFADQARAMHYGEQDHRSIHGEVAPQEARALIEEGVQVAPLPLPVVPPQAKN